MGQNKMQVNGFTPSTALKACFEERSSDFLAVQVQPPISGAGGVVPCQQVRHGCSGAARGGTENWGRARVFSK